MAWNDEQNSNSHIAKQPITTSCHWFMILGQMRWAERSIAVLEAVASCFVWGKGLLETSSRGQEFN